MTQNTIIQGLGLEEVIREEIVGALKNERVNASEFAEFYLVNLLSDFHKHERSFEAAEDAFEKPLATLFMEALNTDPSTRLLRLRRLGDTILVVSGLFTDRVQKTLVKLPYYVSIGGAAYARLANMLDSEREFFDLYMELSRKFAAFVRVIATVAPWNRTAPLNSDIIRAYERWLSSGDSKLESLLEKEGILGTS